VLREYLKGEQVLDGAIAQVRSLHWDTPGVHRFENTDYVVSRPIGRSPGNRPIRWHQKGESGIRPWGAVAIVPPGLPITLEVGTGEVTFITCFFSPEQFEKSLALDAPPADLHAAFISNPFLGAVLDRVAKEILAPQPKSQALIETLVASVTAEIGSLLQQSDETRPAAGALTRRQLRQIIELLEREATQKQSISLQEVAAHCSISVRHLVRAFKKTTGTTIHSYMRQIRLDRIKALLASSNEFSMGQIADATGFATPSQFSAEFRRLAGCSPSAYRKQIRLTGTPGAADAPDTPPD
jgi:AraC family transcriptional regulator